MGARVFSPRKVSASEPHAVEHESTASTGPAVKRRTREAGALLLFAVSLFLCLSLASLRLDPGDPGYSGADWVGPVGAALAGVLVRAFGLVAWLAPVELALLGLPLLKSRPNRATGMRVAGDLIVAIVLSALVYVAAPDLLAFGRMPAGGNVGLLFGELFSTLFSTLGSFIVGGTVVGLILIGRSQFSFIAWCQWVVAFSKRSAARSRVLGHKLSVAWHQARELRRERRDRERSEAKPRIETKPSDEAILAQLSDQPSDEDEWCPVERTGTPPIAMSAALRDSFAASTDLLDVTEPASEPSEPPLADEPAGDAEAGGADERDERAPDDAEPDATPTESKPARRRSRKRGAPAGPKVVDTSPEQRTTRADAEAGQVSTFVLPPTDLLEPPPPRVAAVDESTLVERAELLEKTLADYGVKGKTKEIYPGPTVTTYELAPEAGTKVSKVAGLADDLALGLSRKVRIIAPIPGKSRIGFELPNDERSPVNLRELVEDASFAKLADKAPLPVVIGRDIVGRPYYEDLASMPHVIVAGATGAGKSVGLNVMLSSLLHKRTPDELRLLMVDPKVVELAPFDGIPHLLLPVVTDMKQAATALKWAVDEMERRYQLFANAGTKNITTYNRWVDRVARGEVAPPDPTEVQAFAPDGSMVSVPPAKEGSDGVLLPGRLPFIVVVVDEFADLMMQQGKEVEAAVARLAQKARAAGMHVILATQRPSVDVITGMIKANFPTRIAYRVAQKVDSRTILDEQGAELLLGRGDMLIKMNGSTETRRVQCPFVSEEEVGRLCDHLRAQGAPQYHDAILQASEDEENDEADEKVDARFDEAVRIVADTQRCSTSWLQRKMTIGYNRAAKIVEMMERKGMVGPPNGSKDREVHVNPI